MKIFIRLPDRQVTTDVVQSGYGARDLSGYSTAGTSVAKALEHEGADHGRQTIQTLRGGFREMLSDPPTLVLANWSLKFALLHERHAFVIANDVSS